MQISLFLFLLIFYIYHCAPTVVVSSEFRSIQGTQGNSLGMINQIEYKSASSPITSPLWYMAGRALKVLPLGDYELPYRLNVFSALFGALSVLLLFNIISGYRHDRHPEERRRGPGRFFSNELPAVIICLLFAFSYPFWMLSEYAGPDTMQVFLLLLVIYMLIRAYRTRVFRNFYYAVGAIALGMGTYPLITVIAPVLLAVIILKTLQVRGAFPALLIYAVLLVAGLALYLYHPITYLLQDHGDYPQYGSILEMASAILKWQFGFFRRLFKPASLLWLPVALGPIPWIFVRRADTITFKTASHVTRIAMNVLLLPIGFFFLLNIDRRITDPMRIDFMMYSPQNPLPFVLLSLWLGYLLGYAFHIFTGKMSPPRVKSGARPLMPLFKVAAILFLLLPAGLFWLNRGGPVARVQLSRADFAGSRTGCSLRGFYAHERAGMNITKKIKELQFEPDVEMLVADTIVTNLPAFAYLLQHLRDRGEIRYKHVVNAPPFETTEWYYNRMMEHAFQIDPGNTWLVGKYATLDAIYEAVIRNEVTVVWVLASSFEKSLAEYADHDFNVREIAWFDKRDMDSLSSMMEFLLSYISEKIQKSEQPRDIALLVDRVDEVLLLMLELSPDDLRVAEGIEGQLEYYARSNQFAQAERFVRQAVRIKAEFEYLQHMIEGLRHQYSAPPNMDEAIKAFKRSIDLKPTAHACNNVAILLYEQGEYDEAYKYAKQAYDLSEESTDIRSLASVIDTLGWIAFKIGLEGEEEKLEEGRKLLEEAYEKDPRNAYVILHYGATLLYSEDLGTRNKGINLLKRVEESVPRLEAEAGRIRREAEAYRKEHY